MFARIAHSLFLVASLLSVATASSSDTLRKRCQLPTAKIVSDCPSQVVVVGKNSTLAKFESIQDAILSLPNDNSARTILVLPGNYTEQLNVTRTGPVTLLGQTGNSQVQSANKVNVIWSAANFAGSGFTDNAFTSTLTVAPNLNASLTGAGTTGFDLPIDTPFGNTDFRVYNINFVNDYAPRTAGPALAVSVSRANAGFYHCGFYSYQDTVYIGKLGNAVFYGGEIAGQTDFLYGFGTAWIEKSKLTLRGCGGGIIAWKGLNTTYANKNGCYVSNSSLLAANSSIAPTMVGACALGRPWNAQQRSVYLNTYMDASILPIGYKGWTNDPATNRINNYTFMAEYKSYGPGFNLTARIAGNITKELNAKTVAPYDNPRDVFMTPQGVQPNVAWIDRSIFEF